MPTGAKPRDRGGFLSSPPRMRSAAPFGGPPFQELASKWRDDFARVTLLLPGGGLPPHHQACPERSMRRRALRMGAS